MSSVQPGIHSDASGEAAYGRYVIKHVLGQGGMAVVYEAIDTVHGRRIALKRLREAPEHKTEAVRAIFQREFLALAQLAHPRIVAVYDYGVDEQGPYYTMELLDGGDLRSLAPVDYRTACALARDVCSALALVHSRRKVFRDISPSNVRCTSERLGKLFDFGGLAPMGPCADMVGTYPCTPPEALLLQSLDARTDLYALGATLYFSLVCQHAYPGRSVDELKRLWRAKPRPPSDLVPGIPAALDQLVYELLQLEPERRPRSAAEVMERLSAIAQLPQDESLLVEQSYMASPLLVARDAELDTMRQHAERALNGAGSSLVIAGESGTGGTRLLEMCALEAKLSGMIALRIAARDAAPGDYGALRAITGALLEQAPRLARLKGERQRDVLELLAPKPKDGDSQPANQPELQPQEHQHRLQAGLREWLFEIADEKPLLIAIDDLDAIDPLSAAFVALLARELSRHAILLVSTRQVGRLSSKLQALQDALHILKRASTQLRLTALELPQTEQLLSAVFGDVPHLALAAQHIQRVTRGLPRDVMSLARHLVSEGKVRYEAGAWSLPQELNAADLPASMTEALEQRVHKLGPDARLLGYLLCADPALGFRAEQLARLGELAPERVAPALKELIAQELALESQGLYRACQAAAVAPLAALLDDSTRRLMQVRLGEHCVQQDDALRATQHLFRGLEEERGLEVLLAHARSSMERTDANNQAFLQLLRSLPDGWFETYEQGLLACSELGRPAHEWRALVSRLVGILALTGTHADGWRYVNALLQALARDVGLDLVAALPGKLSPLDRMRIALAQAGARTQATAAPDRGLAPASAIREFALVMASALGVIARDSDYEAWRQLPSIAPLGVLSPALQVLDQLTQGLGLRIGGKNEEAMAIYARILERLAAPDRAGLEPSHHLHTHTRVMAISGILEATMGRASCLEIAARVAEQPRYQTSALGIERLFHLFHGHTREARNLELRSELQRVQSNDNFVPEAHYEFSELFAHALASDLTGVKRSSDSLEQRGMLRTSIRAAWHYGRGERQRIRGAHAAALADFERTLALMAPGEHLLWAPAATAHLRALLELQRTEEAYAHGQLYLAASEQLGYMREHVRAALGLVLAKRGERDAAVQLAEQAIAGLRKREISGLILGAAYEARMQIAALAGDQPAFRTYAALHAAVSGGARPVRSSMREVASLSLVAARERQDMEALSQLQLRRESCQTFSEYATAALEMLAARSGAVAGFLFTRGDKGLVRAASFGSAGNDAEVAGWATDYFKHETEHISEIAAPAATGTTTGAVQSESRPPFTPVLLGHEDAHGYAFTGIALLLIGAGTEPKLHSPRLLTELSRTLGELQEVSPEYL